MSQLADLLRGQMELNGWGKRELEAQTGVTRASIDHILDGGRVVPRLDTLEKFGNRFGLPLWKMIELCGFDLGYPKTADERAKRLAAVMEAMPQFQPIVDQVVGLGPQQLDGLLIYLEVLQRRGQE